MITGQSVLEIARVTETVIHSNGLNSGSVPLREPWCTLQLRSGVRPYQTSLVLVSFAHSAGFEPLKGSIEMNDMIRAVDMARDRGVDPKAFRKALRAESFNWHVLKQPWTVPRGSLEHRDMESVLNRLIASVSKGTR